MSDGCFPAVAGENHSVAGEGEELLADGAHERVVVAAREVGAAYRALEECVAGDDESRQRTVEGYASRGVAGDANDFDHLVAETEGVAVVERNLDAARLEGHAETEARGLFGKSLGQEGVGGFALDFQAVFIFDVCVAEYVVKVGVGVDELCDLEIVSLYEAVESLALTLVDHSWVHYGGLVAFGIPHDVCVDSEHIEYETAYFHNST